MKINHYVLPQNPSAQDLETLSMLQTVGRDREKRLANFDEELTKLTGAIWNDLRETLTINGATPPLPAAPVLCFFFVNEVLGLNLSDHDDSRWLMRLDLEKEKRIPVDDKSGVYHQRLLDIVASLIFGRHKEAVSNLAEEFYLLANIDQLVARYSDALASVALDKVRHDAAAKADQTRTQERLSWDDLILPAETKEDLQTYCEILRRADHYRKQGIHVPKGLLLVGPPGTGKTQTARILSREAGFKFLACSTADLKVGWIGHAAAKVKDVFSEARSQEPALVFLDELDAICPPRGRYNDCLSQELTAQLLTELDGVSSNGQAIFTVAATNRIDMIDDALLSRFTEHIAIGLPCVEDRMKLLKLFIGKAPLNGPNGTTQLEILARMALATEGKSGRDLKNKVDKARMRAIKRSIKAGNSNGNGHEPVTLEEGDFVANHS